MILSKLPPKAMPKTTEKTVGNKVEKIDSNRSDFEHFRPIAVLP
jgi:hypothetical protein